jgi:carboxybiotin decarboxylase
MNWAHSAPYASFEKFVPMHAMGANAAGQLASVVAGGVVLALMGAGK